jgi:hypothetical protein
MKPKTFEGLLFKSDNQSLKGLDLHEPTTLISITRNTEYIFHRF